MSAICRTFHPFLALCLTLVAFLAFASTLLKAQSRNNISQWPSAQLKAEAESEAQQLWSTLLTQCGDTYYYAGSGLDMVSQTGQPIPYKNGLGGDVTKYEGVRMFVVPPGKGTAATQENAVRLGIVDGGIAIMASTTFSSGIRQQRNFGPAIDGPLSNTPLPIGGIQDPAFGAWYAKTFVSSLADISGGPGSGGSIRIHMQKENGEWKFSLIGLLASDPRSIYQIQPEHKFSCKETKALEDLSVVPDGCQIESTLRSTPRASEPLNLNLVNRIAGATKIYSVGQDGQETLRGTLKINTSGTIASPSNTYYVAKDDTDRCIEVTQTKTDDAIFRIEYPSTSQCSGWTTSDPPDKATRAMAISSGVLQGNLISSVSPVYPQGVSTPITRPGQPIVVALKARIGSDGHVRSLAVQETPSCEFANAAIAAVSQWVYKPATLGGQAVLTDSTVNVTFPLPVQSVNSGASPMPAPSQGSQLFQEYYAGCKAGDAKACEMVGYCYKGGREGVSVDLKLAKQYYDQSCSMGRKQGCIESKFVKVQ